MPWCTNDFLSTIWPSAFSLSNSGCESFVDIRTLRFENPSLGLIIVPQDPNLYGQRSAKRQKREMALTSSLSFSSQINTLLASSSSSGKATTPARARTPTLRSELLSGGKPKRNGGQGGDGSKERNKDKLVLRETNDTEDDKAERLLARKKMESKARLYHAMKRGDYVAREGDVAPLVDFDRKWAEARERDDQEGESSSGNGSDDDDDDGGNIDSEIIEYEDEFGRLRRGIRAEKMRMERRSARGAASAQELDRMSARPRAPDSIIYGDAVASRRICRPGRGQDA